MTCKYILIGLVAALATACSTRTVTSDITAAPTGAHVAGVPFRTRAPHTLRVFQRQDDESYKQVFVTRLEMADMDRIYALNYDSKAFSNHEFNVAMREDGTLSNFNMTSKSTGAAALTATSGALKGVSDAVVAMKAQEKADSEARRTAADTTLIAGEDALVAAQTAQHNAEAAMRALAALPPGTPDDVVHTAQEAVESAQLLANIAFRRAGLPAPYGPPFPR